jgi:rhodanese-related sulfurtransferase
MARYRSVRLVAALLSALLLGAVGCRDAVRSGYPSQITAAELAKRVHTPPAPLILDVRSPREYAAGHVPGAVNIPHTQLAYRLGELGIDKSEEVVVYCQVGKRAALAEQVLAEAGYTGVLHLEGQMRAWQRGGYPTE